MNKKSIILAASALAIIVSCNVREDVLPLPQKTAFKAVMADVPPTKTVLQSDGSVFWSPGDAINLFYGDVVAQKMVYDSTASVAAEATFTGELPQGFAPNGSDEFWAVYPYSKETSFDGSSVTLYLPEVQTAVEGTFADDLFVSLAHSTGYELSFYNLCGGIKFSVANPGIQSVTFQGLNDEVLSGQVKVTFNAEGKPVVLEPIKNVNLLLLNAPDGQEFEVGKWYYMVSLPATLTNGYRMTFYGQDGEMVAERISEDPVTIKRAVWGKLTEADYVAEEEQPNNEIWYTTTDDSLANLSSDGAFDVTVTSHTYENGKGVVRFDGPVTKMLTRAFGQSNLQTVSLPETLVNLEAGFEGCTLLESIHLPSHLEYVSSHLVYYDHVIKELEFPTTDNIAENWSDGPIALCINMERLTGPYATDDNRALIKDGKLFAFAGAGLTSYSIPSGVTSLGGESFAGFTNLEHVTLPETLTQIGYMAFASAGISSIEIPQTVTLIRSSAFDACFNLKSIFIPENTDIDPEAFDNCNSLESFSGRYASEDGRCLIKGTELYAFAPGGLTSYSIPEGVTYIYSGFGAYSASNASSVESLTLPVSLTGIRIFWIPSLKELTCLSEAPPTIAYSHSLRMANVEAIYVPAASVDTYKSAQYWSEYADKIMPIEGESISASKYLTFTSEGTTTVSMRNEGNNAPVLYYSTDAQTWTQWDYSALQFTSNAPLYLCGNNPDGFSTSSSDYSMFTSEGDSFAVSGDIMSLINYSSDVLDIPCPYCFFMLFGGNNILTSGPELPATGLTESCYSSMYASCINLVSAPVFPAATTLAQFCYQNMFFRCSKLVEAPALPFTTLAEYCYHSMFYYSGLKEAPVLPATVLVTGCYIDMFYGCTELASVKCLATDISAVGCLTDWLYAVADQGVFVKDADTQWPTGSSGIPDGWTVMNDGDVPGGGNEGTGDEDMD